MINIDFNILKNTPKVEDDTDWWPMFLHDQYHSGYSNSTAPETSSVLWTYSTGDWIESSPAVVDGKVYIGSEDNKVYCLNAITGEIIWTYPTHHLVVSSPAVNDGKVYIGSTDHKLYCLNADSGSYIWSYQTGWGIAQSSPVIVNGKVYVGSQDNKMYCLDAETGVKIWDYYTGNWISSSPAIYNGKVYFGSFDSKIYCLNADNGSKIWDYSTGDIIWTSSPTISDGKVFIGSLNCIIYCLNATSGMELWNYTTGDWISSSPSVASGKVFIGSDDGKIYCFNSETGIVIWYYQTNGAISASPAIANGKVYIGSSNKIMYCLNEENGSKIWEYKSAGQILSSAAIYEGRVYVGCMDKKVYCFGNLSPIADFIWTPTNPYTGQIITFNASSSYDSNGYIILYEWDWNNDGIYDESHEKPTATYSWLDEGIYPVTLQVTDNDGKKDTQTKTVKINIENHPPNIPSINGPTKFKPNQTKEFIFMTNDQDNDQIYYYIDWGDGVTVNWQGPYNSGYLLKLSHAWTEKSKFIIKCKAKDIYGAESEISTFDISTPKTRVINPNILILLENHLNLFPFLHKLFNI